MAKTCLTLASIIAVGAPAVDRTHSMQSRIAKPSILISFTLSNLRDAALVARGSFLASLPWGAPSSRIVDPQKGRRGPARRLRRRLPSALLATLRGFLTGRMVLGFKIVSAWSNAAAGWVLHPT